MFSLEDIANLLTWTTGFGYKESDILKIGANIMAKEIFFNQREGFTKKDDYLPEKMRIPIPEGKSKGNFISDQELESMKNEYYETRKST